MPLQREVLPDAPEVREKFLCAFRVAKTAHAPKQVPLGDTTLAFACRVGGCSLRGCSAGRPL